MPSHSSPNAAPDLKAALVENALSSITDDMVTEHILLAGDDSGLEAPRETKPARSAQERFVLSNRILHVRTELTFYHGGYLGVRQSRRGKPMREVTLDLRFIDVKPSLSRFVPRAWLKAGLWLIVGAAIVGVLAYFSVMSSATAPASALLLVAGLCAWIVAGYLFREQVVLRTLHGQVPVLKLVANPGCLSACRRLVPKVIAAIKQAHTLTGSDKPDSLRQEMREHYRLREVGVITSDACETGTRRILTRFG